MARAARAVVQPEVNEENVVDLMAIAEDEEALDMFNAIYASVLEVEDISSDNATTQVLYRIFTNPNVKTIEPELISRLSMEDLIQIYNNRNNSDHKSDMLISVNDNMQHIGMRDMLEYTGGGTTHEQFI